MWGKLSEHQNVFTKLPLFTTMDYKKGLQRIELVAPAHPLLPMLQQGETAINRMYMEQVLKEIKDLPEVTPKSTLSADKPNDAYKEIKALYAKKNKTRNQYFICKSNKERKVINRQLIVLRSDIHTLFRRIEYYEKNGTFPAIQDVEPAIISEENPMLLNRMLLNTRSNISRYKKKITTAYEQNASKSDIEKLELRLKRFTEKKDSIEQKLSSTKATKQN